MDTYQALLGGRVGCVFFFVVVVVFVFFFNDTATTEIYTLSLHDALPICDDQTVVMSSV